MDNHPVKEVKRTDSNLMQDMSAVKRSSINELGYFGNIWVRSHHYKNAGDTNGDGHYHYFDHVTLLATGSVKVEVDGHPAKEFHAPTFIVISKDHKHKITALTDDVVYFCVFAIRDIDGEVVEEIYGKDVTPLSWDAKSDEEWRVEQLIKQLDKKTTHD